MKLYNFTIDQLTEYANVYKETVVDGLVREKILSEEQGKYISENYAVIVSESGFFGSIIRKLRGSKDNVFEIDFVKII